MASIAAILQSSMSVAMILTSTVASSFLPTFPSERNSEHG